MQRFGTSKMYLSPSPPPSKLPSGATGLSAVCDCDVCHWKDETVVFQFIFRCPPPPRPKMPFGQIYVAINIYNICKGHFGSWGGEASKNKLKDTIFIFPMTNVTNLGVFHTHAQKEYRKVLEMKSTYILNILVFLVFLKLAMYLLKVWSKRHPV